jgi:hypothetical protein
MSTLLLIVGFAGLIVGGVLLKIARMTRRLAEVRHSSIASARGLVEISGVARAVEGARTRDPEGVSCVWHRVLVEIGADDDRPEDRKIESGKIGDPAVDTILLDDGTGRCAMVIGKSLHSFEREERREGRNTRRVTLRIREGTRMHAVGRIEKLERPERGATHRIIWDPGVAGGYSNRSIETMAADIPMMTKWGIGLLVVGAPALAWGLWLAFGPMWLGA